MALESFARQSLAQFAIIYAEIFEVNQGKAIAPDQLETLMWGRMCAKEAGITKTGLKIPFENIKRAKVTLPYMPDNITYTGCCAIKKNGGLYTPCCGKVLEDSVFCKTCSIDKEGEAKELEFGSMEDRESNVEDERFAPVTFGEWMKGHKTTITEVYSKLAAAGIALEVPAEQLVCRTLPKTRRGRPSKSDEEVSDEDSAPKAPKKKPTPKAKAKSPAASEDEAPKKKPKAKAESESESEVEQPKPKPKTSPKASPKASPAASEDEAPKKVTKPKAESDSESEVEKPKKVSPKPSPKTSPKASPAVSEDEAPKKKVKEPKAEKKAKEPKAEKAEKPEKKAKEPKAEKAKEPKAEKAKEPKAEKPEKAKAEKPKEPKAEKPKKAKAPEPEPEPELDVDALAAAFEDEEPEEEEVETCEVDGIDYDLRNSKYICSKDDGTILGTIDDEGDVVWNSDKR